MMGFLTKKKSKSGGDGPMDRVAGFVKDFSQRRQEADEIDRGPPNQARSAEDFGAIDVDDFESFDGANIAALRDAHSNQRRQFTTGEEAGLEEGEDDGADVRIGEEDADLSGSRKRKRSPTGAAGTSSLSPSIRI